MHRGAVAVFVALAGVAVPAVGQMPETFDRVDRDSRTLLQTLRCASTTGRLRAGGSLGVPDSLGDRGACSIDSGRFYGVILSTDSAVTRAILFNVVDFGTRQLYRGPIDTSAVLAMLRAQDAAVLRGYAPYEKANRQFSPIAFRTDGDSVSVWLLPIAQSATQMLGGEHGYLYSPDGRTLVRQADAFQPYRAFAIPDTGVVVIPSSSDSIPTMTEMMTANALNKVGRTVRIETKVRSSTLTGSGRAAVWVHVRKP